MAQSEAPHVRGFLFADLRGYTRFVETHGDRAASELLSAYRPLVRGAVANFSGAEIRTEGDGFYIVFPSPSSAIRCALAILETAASSADAAGGPLAVGIGIHAGETEDSAEGFVGSAVNIAARVCALAGPGELLITETVRGLVRTSLPLTIEPRGRRHLKGIGEPIALFAVRPPGGAPLRARGLRAVATRSLERRPVVAGFAALAGVAAVATVVIATGLLAGANAHPGTSQIRSPAGSVADALPGTGLTGEIAAPTRTTTGSGGIVLVDLGTRRVTPLTTDPSDADPAWSPNGQKLSFTRGAGVRKALYVLDLYTHELLRPASAATVQARNPSWSPSGDRIAFVDCCGNGGSGAVMVVDLKTGSVTQVPGPVPPVQDALLEPAGSSWGDRGIVVSFQTWIGGIDSAQPERRLWLINPGTGEWQPVVAMRAGELADPAWSPDGTRLAFTAAPALGHDNRDVYVSAMDAADPVDVSDAPGIESSPTWSPDGSWIAYSTSRGGGTQIFARQVDGSTEIALTIPDSSTSYLEPAWRP